MVFFSEMTSFDDAPIFKELDKRANPMTWTCPVCRDQRCLDKGVAESAQGDRDKLLRLMEKRPAGRHASYTMLELATSYRGWPGCSVSPRQEVFWLQKAAALGLSQAQSDLGNHCRQGTGGLKKDRGKACDLYRLAAEAGSADAQNCLAHKYLDGDGVEVSAKKAYSWFLKAAEQGHAEAQSYCHTMLLQGHGVATNKKESFFWAEKAAMQGNLVAMGNVANAYFCPETFDNIVQQDMEKAKMWTQRAADGGLESSIRMLAALNGDDGASELKDRYMLREMREEAGKGNASYQFRLGLLYGADEEEPDAKAARTIGIPYDLAKSIKWITRASQQGFTDAQFQLGKAYMSERGVPLDMAEALRLLQLATDQGHAGAAKMVQIAHLMIKRASEEVRAQKEREVVGDILSDFEVTSLLTEGVLCLKTNATDEVVIIFPKLFQLMQRLDDCILAGNKYAQEELLRFLKAGFEVLEFLPSMTPETEATMLAAYPDHAHTFPSNDTVVGVWKAYLDQTSKQLDATKRASDDTAVVEVEEDTHNLSVV